ncbi:MAG: HEAT repeat domain-containing protein [Burkholderiales bacterium]|nr:HEAT repeat domain-containing protein [Burkholderiales bacterium]
MFNTSSELGLRLALALGLVSMAVAIGLALQVTWMRLRGIRRARERAALHDRWRPLLAGAALGEDLPDMLHALRSRERTDWILLWIALQDGMRGSAHEGLNRIAERLGLHDDALRWTRPGRGAMARRVIGLIALGHFGRADDWAPLRAALDDPLPLVSVGAARALLQIDARRAVPAVLDEFLKRPDWPAPRLGTLLREAGAEAVASPLVERLLEGSPEQQRRLLPLLRFAESPLRGGVLHQLVERSSDPQVLSIALRQLCGPDALPRVRSLAQHDDALVRSAAAQALGQIGRTEDRGRLMAMMSDRDWWVRYRAAEAQLALPGTNAAAIIELRRLLTDRFARAALDHVCAERALRTRVEPR